MKYDAGALRKYPRQSETFRFLTEQGPGHGRRSTTWPPHIQLDMGIFMHTPGVSGIWIEHVFGWPKEHAGLIKPTLRKLHPQIVRLGQDNLLTANYDDATRYCTRGPVGTRMPMWALPFFLEDVKNKVSYRELRQRWGKRDRMRKKDFLNIFG
jgi:hypothetical protein